MERFLRDHPDGVIWDDAGYALWKTLTTKAAENDDRSGRFGASSRGMCLRRQIFGYLGMPEVRIIELELRNLFNDGKWRHLRWQMMCLQAGALTHAELQYSLPDYHLSGSMDGFHEEKSFGFELKGDRNFSRVMDGVPESHNLQIHTMMFATGLDTFCYLVEDKASQEWREIIVRRDPQYIALVKEELEELNEYIEWKKLPPMLPSCKSKMGPYRGCPFNSQCLSRSKEGDAWPEQRSWDNV